MAPREYTIASDSDDDPRRARRKKARSFSAHLLASISADALWSGGQVDTQVDRPVCAWFAGSEEALRPFVANLREGRRAVPPGASKRSSDKGFEFLRSSGLQVAWQRYPEGSVVRLWLPDLFAVDPGFSDPSLPVAFVASPTAAWAAGLGLPATQEAAVWAHLDRVGRPRDWQLPGHLPALALWWAAQLDRRIDKPLVSDVRFAAQLLCAFVEAPFSWPHHRGAGYVETDVEAVGLLSGVATCAEHEAIGALVAREIERYYAALEAPATRGPGKPKPAAFPDVRPSDNP